MSKKGKKSAKAVALRVSQPVPVRAVPPHRTAVLTDVPQVAVSYAVKRLSIQLIQIPTDTLKLRVNEFFKTKNAEPAWIEWASASASLLLTWVTTSEFKKIGPLAPKWVEWSILIFGVLLGVVAVVQGVRYWLAPKQTEDDLVKSILDASSEPRGAEHDDAA